MRIIRLVVLDFISFLLSLFSMLPVLIPIGVLLHFSASLLTEDAKAAIGTWIAAIANWIFMSAIW